MWPRLRPFGYTAYVKNHMQLFLTAEQPAEVGERASSIGRWCRMTGRFCLEKAFQLSALTVLFMSFSGFLC